MVNINKVQVQYVQSINTAIFCDSWGCTHAATPPSSS